MTFSGTLQVTDRCGFLGANYTSPIIPVPAGGLSTLSYVVPFHVQQGVKTGAYDPGMFKQKLMLHVSETMRTNKPKLLVQHTARQIKQPTVHTAKRTANGTLILISIHLDHHTILS